MSKIKVKATIINGILGTLPADPEIYKNYIATKSPDASSIADEIESLGVEKVYNAKLTIFPKDENGNPFLYNYLIKGFFKNAARTMREIPGTESSKFKNFIKKIDNRIFVWPRKIPLFVDGEKATKDIITINERPLRASTPAGERIGLSASEMLPDGTVLEFEVETLGNDLDNLVIELLDYGKYNGLGQWHNSGMGSFSYTYEIEELGEINTDVKTADTDDAKPKRGRKKKTVE